MKKTAKPPIHANRRLQRYDPSTPLTARSEGVRPVALERAAPAPPAAHGNAGEQHQPEQERAHRNEEPLRGELALVLDRLHGPAVAAERGAGDPLVACR